MDHDIQPGAGHGEERHGLGGTVEAGPPLLAKEEGDRLVHQLRLVRCPGEVAVDPDPVHLASPGQLLRTHDRDVVLALAGEHAGAAAGAGVEIDRHAPLVLAVGNGNCLNIVQLLLVMVARQEMLTELGEGGLPDQVSPMHGEMVLAARNGRPMAGLGDLQTQRDVGARDVRSK